MNSRSCRWLIVSALVITACGAWAQQSAPPASDQKPETFTTNQLFGTAQCSLPPAFDQKSIAALEQQAASGDAAAQCGLGLMYDKGQGVPQGYAQAAAWYRKAAKQGDATAQWLLGGLYFDGHGVPKDYAQAVLWFRKAAEQGDAEAQYDLGSSYDLGEGVPKDFAEAYFWLDLAAAGPRQLALWAELVAKHRDGAASHLTPADLSREQERARKWFEAHQAKPQ
jgi:TPR repeat protein